jgi:hypothetical protein
VARRPSTGTLAAAAAAAALASWAAPAAAQDGGPGSAPAVSTGALGIEIGGRVQLQAVTSPCSDVPFDDDSPCVEQAPAADMLVRRARLSFDIEVNELIDAKIQPGFAGLDRVELKDAWGRLTFDPAFRLKLGHFKRPFDGFQLTSSTQILTIERDLDVPGVPGLGAPSLDELTTRFRLSDRDVGVMAEGAPDGTGFGYRVGVFNGRGSTDERDLNSAKQVVGRARYTVEVADGLPLTVAAAAASTDLPVTGPDDREGVRASARRHGNYELWAELGDFTPGPHVQAGVVLGDNPLQAEDGSDLPPEAGPGAPAFADAAAWQVVGSYRFGVEDGGPVAAVEPVFRVTRADPNSGLDGDAVSGFTPGVQIFFGGRNKIALNLDVVDFEADDRAAAHSFKAQFQAHF